MKVILDSCTYAHFLASGEQRIVTEYARSINAQVAVCATVARELPGILANRPMFRQTGALERWQHIKDAITVLPDDLAGNTRLTSAVLDLHNADLNDGRSLKERLDDPNNLGEFMTAAHALRLSRQGVSVVVLVDDHYGRTLVNIAKNLLLNGGYDHRQILRSHARGVIEKSQPQWRRDALEVDATIARMEKVQKIPYWR